MLPKRPRPDTPDEEWIGEIGRRGWIAVSRDARIRYSPLALSVLMECGTQLFVLVGKLTTAEAAEAFLRWREKNPYPTSVALHR